MRMYILIRESIPLGFAINSAAHGSLACYLKYENTPNMKEWLLKSFKKCVCVVNDKEFENAKTIEDCLVITESALENKEVCLVFCPRPEYPKMFKFFRLFK